MPEGEEEEQEIGNLLEKIMKENLLNLVKEMDKQVQEAQSFEISQRSSPPFTLSLLFLA